MFFLRLRKSKKFVLEEPYAKIFRTEVLMKKPTTKTLCSSPKYTFCTLVLSGEIVRSHSVLDLFPQK